MTMDSCGMPCSDFSTTILFPVTHTLRVPAAIAVVTATGLAVGLLGGGGYDFMAWIGLSLPVIAILYGISRSRRG